MNNAPRFLWMLYHRVPTCVHGYYILYKLSFRVASHYLFHRLLCIRETTHIHVVCSLKLLCQYFRFMHLCSNSIKKPPSHKNIDIYIFCYVQFLWLYKFAFLQICILTYMFCTTGLGLHCPFSCMNWIILMCVALQIGF